MVGQIDLFVVFLYIKIFFFGDCYIQWIIGLVQGVDIVGKCVVFYFGLENMGIYIDFVCGFDRGVGYRQVMLIFWNIYVCEVLS